MDSSAPRFHPPVPASTILSQLRKTQTDPSTGLKLPRLRTGVGDIDDYLLFGGVQRGCVVGVSSGYVVSGREGGRGYASGGDAEGDTGRLSTLHVLARTLLERPHAQASVIDATGSFPLVLLAGVVRWCVERGVGVGTAGGGGGGVEERVNGVLERVGITRVFDVEGLWEVLGEVGGGNRGAEGGGEAKGVEMDEKGGTAEDRGLDEEGGMHDGPPEEVLPSAGTPEIMDSEEDDDDDDDLDTNRPAKPEPQPPTKEPSLNTRSHKASALAIPSRTHLITEIVVVDNLTTLITTLFAHTSPPAAHALLAQLALTLTTLTHSSSLTVFLLNTLVKKSTKAKNANPERRRQRQHSVFAAMTATPSLGMVFDNFVDLHLMCHSLPARAGDAEGVYGVERRDNEDGDGGSGEDAGTGAEGKGDRQRERGGEVGDIRFANVVEVLKDECPQLERWEGVSCEERPGRVVNREQRWATFRVTQGVGLEDDEFGGGKG